MSGGWTPLLGVILPEVGTEPGQRFTEDQLPDPELQRANGIDPDKYRRDMAHLIDEVH